MKRMGYYIDVKKISIDEYRKKLATGYLPPSRMMLKELLSERFDYFQSIGIQNINELLQMLKNKHKLVELQKTSSFPAITLKFFVES